ASILVAGTARAARTHDLAHEVVTAAGLMERFPVFQIPRGYVGVVQPDGGFLAVEASIEAQLALAKTAGAEILTETEVRTIHSNRETVRIEIDERTID